MFLLTQPYKNLKRVKDSLDVDQQQTILLKMDF